MRSTALARLIFTIFCLLGLSSAADAQTTESLNQPGSMLSISAELPVNDLSDWLSRSVPSEFVGDGERKVCKRLLGLKACGDANWEYRVDRTGAIVIPQPTNESRNLRVDVPLEVNARVGVDGDVARALGIRSVPVHAEFIALVDVLVTGTENGCPFVQANITPKWVSNPTAVLAGNIKISLTEVLEDALQKQVGKLQKRINDELNCDRILNQLAPFWSMCHVDATRENTGPGLWIIHPQKLHWSVQTLRDNKTLGLVVGVDSQINLQFGLTEEDVASRLRISECAAKWKTLATPLADPEIQNTPSLLTGSRLVFDPNMKSHSSQRLNVHVTHQAMSEFAEDNYAHRNLGKDEGGNEVVLKTVSLLPGVSENDSALTLETQFEALVKASDGFSGWIQKALGFGEKNLRGVMRVETTPVWDSQARNLEFQAVQASVTSLEPGSKFSLDNAVFGLMQRHVQKTLAQQSTVPVGESIDALTKKLNSALDTAVQASLTSYGGLWHSNTAVLQVNDIAALGQGMALDAQLSANWVIRFSGKAWPAAR